MKKFGQCNLKQCMVLVGELRWPSEWAILNLGAVPPPTVISFREGRTTLKAGWNLLQSRTQGMTWCRYVYCLLVLVSLWMSVVITALVPITIFKLWNLHGICMLISIHCTSVFEFVSFLLQLQEVPGSNLSPDTWVFVVTDLSLVLFRVSREITH